MSDPRIVGLAEAKTIIADLARAWPVDIFGDDLSAEEWQQVRSAGIRTERIASECYRHALRVACQWIDDAIAQDSEGEA